MEEKKYFNIAQFARKIGVSRPTISIAIKNGRLRTTTVKGKRLLLWPEQRDVYLEFSKYASNLISEEKKETKKDEKEIEKKLNSPIENLGDARFQAEAFKAKKAKLEYKELNGELIEINEVKNIWFGLGSELKKSILAIPDRVGPILAGESSPHKCKRILKNELIQSLKSMIKSNRKNKSIHTEIKIEETKKLATKKKKSK